MKIDCISDLHGFQPELSGGDLLIIAGDLTAGDKTIQYENFFSWLRQQDYKKKIFISGNHDNQSMSQFDWYDAVYLHNTGTEFEGLKIWGSPDSLWFKGINKHCTAFTGDEAYLESKYNEIPHNVDILITHTPPFGVLDLIRDRSCKCGYYCKMPVGSKSLLARLESDIKPKLHVFGHIHENGGKTMTYKRPGCGDENNTICVNASIMNQDYEPLNKPIRIEYQNYTKP